MIRHIHIQFNKSQSERTVDGRTSWHWSTPVRRRIVLLRPCSRVLFCFLGIVYAHEGAMRTLDHRAGATIAIVRYELAPHVRQRLHGPDCKRATMLSPGSSREAA